MAANYTNADHNVKIAKAIVALYAVATQPEVSNEWSDTDELLQDVAFRLYSAVHCYEQDFAVFMMQAGASVQLVSDFLDLPENLIERLRKKYRKDIAGER